MMKVKIQAIEGRDDDEDFLFVPVEFTDESGVHSGPEAAVFIKDLLKTLKIEFEIETLPYGSLEMLGYQRKADAV